MDWNDQVQLSHIVERDQAYEGLVENWRELDASTRLVQGCGLGRHRIAWWHERVAAIKAERMHVDALNAKFETLQGVCWTSTKPFAIRRQTASRESR